MRQPTRWHSAFCKSSWASVRTVKAVQALWILAFASAPAAPGREGCTAEWGQPASPWAPPRGHLKSIGARQEEPRRPLRKKARRSNAQESGSATMGAKPPRSGRRRQRRAGPPDGVPSLNWTPMSFACSVTPGTPGGVSRRPESARPPQRGGLPAPDVLLGSASAADGGSPTAARRRVGATHSKRSGRLPSSA